MSVITDTIRSGKKRNQVRKWAAGLVAVGAALAAFPGTAGAQVEPTPPKACEHGQFTVAEMAQNRDNFVQFVVHYNKAFQCQFDVPPDFHAPQ
jgi:hypothetical protein